MTVKLSSLRVTAELDVSQYVRAAAEKENADKRITSSSAEAGRALAAQDAVAQKVGSGVASLSRQYITGYSEAAKFETAVRSLGAALDRGMDVGRAAAALDGIYRKFGQVADATALAKQGYVALVPVVGALNQQYEISAAVQDRAATASRKLAEAQQFQQTINQRLTGDKMGGRTVAYGDARNSASAFMDAWNPLEAQQRMETNQRLATASLGIGRSSLSAQSSAAVFQQELDRLDEIARMKSAQIGQNFGTTLEASLISGTRKSARDAAAVFQTEFDRLDEIAKQRAAQNATSAQAGFNQFMGIGRQGKSAQSSAEVFQEAARAESDLERRRSAIVNQLLPLQAETDRHIANQKEILALGKEVNATTGKRVLSQDEVNRALDAEKLRYEQSKKSIEGMYIVQGKYASGVGLARNEVVNLSRQLQDVAVTLQAGQPLSTILLQQGTQIMDIFTSSRATMSGFFSQAVGGFKAMATSAAGVVGSLAAVGLALTYLGTRYGDSQREVERQLGGVGRGSGLSVDNINAIAEAQAQQQRISISSSRNIASTFAGTGRLDSGNVTALSALTRDFAAQTGSDLQAATSELAKAFSGDVVRGAEQLNEKLGFLDARTRSYIKTLQDQGNRQAAIKVTLDAMRPSIDGAAERVNVFTKAWQSLAAAASNAADRAGQAAAGSGASLQQQLTNLQSTLRDRQNSFFGGTAGGNAELQARISELQEQIRRQEQLRASQTQQANTARLSLEVAEIVKGLDPAVERAKELRAELTKIDQLLSSDRGRGATGNLADTVRAQEATRNALATNLTLQERTRQEGDLAVRSIMARTFEEQKSVAIDRERLNLAGQKLTSLQQELQIQNQIAQVQANALREARDANRSANDNASLAGLLPYERAVREQQIRMRELRTRTEPGAGDVPGRAAAGGMDVAFYGKVQALIAAIGDEGARMTSGFRTREQQEALFNRYGPGKAARPGSSQHESGTAADYVFSSPAARARALEMAGQHGLRALPSNGGAVHFDLGARGAQTNGLGSQTKAYNDNTSAAEKNALALENIALPLRRNYIDLKAQEAALDNQEKLYTRTAFQIGKAAKEQELINQFNANGVPITASLAEQISKLGDAYGRSAERAASLRLTQDATFEREQMFRNPIEAGIASRLRGTGIGMDSEVAGLMRYNAELARVDQIGSGAFRSIADAVAQGNIGMKTFGNILKDIGSQLLQMGAQNLWKSAFGGLFGGGQSTGGGFGGLFSGIGSLFGFGGGGGFGGGASLLSGSGGLYANGAAFSGGNVIPFAKGGITMGPTYFPMSGGRTGLMGEAGEEAIMPLKRGANGALGVAVHGAASGGGGVTVTMGDTNITISGGATEDTVAQIKSAMAAERQKIAEELPAMIYKAQKLGKIA
jgi:phage-related minor tail protein